MLIGLLAFAIILLAAMVHFCRVPIRHRWRRRQARTMSAQLRGRDRGQPAALIYARVRAMDALAFEELLLESFRSRGHPITSNRRYTGDGGVDGQVTIDGKRWLIQAKRYKSAIRPEHVEQFAQLCRRRNMPGLFIHTGRTGPASRSIVARSAHIEILSGNHLIALLSGDPLTVGRGAI